VKHSAGQAIRGLDDLSRGLVALIVLKTIIATLIALAYLRHLLALSGDASAVDDATRSIGSLDVPNEIALYAVVVTWLFWQGRAHRAMRESGVTGLRFTPTSGVLWWFVPFANLVVPYGAMRELRTAGADPESDDHRRAARFLLWTWWVPWIGQLGTAEIILFVPRGAVSDVLLVFSELCLLVAAPGAILAVRAITRRLEVLTDARTPATPEPVTEPGVSTALIPAVLVSPPPPPDGPEPPD
jgi:Domain of unknown function (DUF4328)